MLSHGSTPEDGHSDISIRTSCQLTTTTTDKWKQNKTKMCFCRLCFWCRNRMNQTVKTIRVFDRVKYVWRLMFVKYVWDLRQGATRRQGRRSARHAPRRWRRGGGVRPWCAWLVTLKWSRPEEISSANWRWLCEEPCKRSWPPPPWLAFSLWSSGFVPVSPRFS